MLFTIQTYLEEYLSKRNLVDSDGYAISVANLYFYHRTGTEVKEFLRRVRRTRTVLFVNKGIRDSAGFERTLVSRLDSRFKKKLEAPNPFSFPGGTETEKQRLERYPD